MTAKKNKKAKKSFCPRASTGNTHHGMRYAGSKLFSDSKIHKIIIISATCLVVLLRIKRLFGLMFNDEVVDFQQVFNKKVVM